MCISLVLTRSAVCVSYPSYVSVCSDLALSAVSWVHMACKPSGEQYLLSAGGQFVIRVHLKCAVGKFVVLNLSKLCTCCRTFASLEGTMVQYLCLQRTAMILCNVSKCNQAK